MALDGQAVAGEGAIQAWSPTPASIRASRPITIGLVNNMPDAALLATENQFRRIVQSVSSGFDVCLKLFSFPEIARSDAARVAMGDRYASTEGLPSAGVDALIVTGAEPLAADLRDEPYWASLAALVDWADANTVPTVWSCLAAHAAVLHLDGIRRKPLPEKCSGVFTVAQAARHPLLTNHAEPLRVPHSRLNGLEEVKLSAAGYRILTRSEAIGVDAFVRERRGGFFLFLQGHPEYDADSIALEYRRDLRRFLRGERKDHPAVPAGYFEAETERALKDLAAATALRPEAAALSLCAKLITAAPPKHSWAATTARLYSNWFNMISAQLDAPFIIKP